jgi:protocatechuate 3,4-dioxygenase beta subunit
MKIFAIFIAIVTALFFFSGYPGLKASAAVELEKTPADYEGPFYPHTRQDDIDNDLVHIKGKTGVATGEILNLSGMVVNTKGDPQEGVTIEIWQADPQGRYKHSGDSSPGERDPHFQYWGADVTDTSGSFFFKTVVPGAYFPRPAHIHFKIWKDGKLLLTSQIYFTKLVDGTPPPPPAGKMQLQTVMLKPLTNGEFDAYFRIVL